MEYYRVAAGAVHACFARIYNMVISLKPQSIYDAFERNCWITYIRIVIYNNIQGPWTRFVIITTITLIYIGASYNNTLCKNNSIRIHVNK